jgi:SAM-dependent methyltransferase
MNSSEWDQRYGDPEYFYGVEPNKFLSAQAPAIPAGPVLCLAEGEGRNAVFLAGLGHAVTAVDQSANGLAKARRLARSRGANLTTVCVDLADFTIEAAAWSGVVVIFMHLPAPLRRTVLGRAVVGLRAGGVLVLEAYTPAQVAFGTGGPRDPALCPTLEELRRELAGLELVIGREIERDVREGGGHTGLSAVVQVLARKV